jgi:hypothetical protein
MSDSWTVYDYPISRFSAKFPERPIHDTKYQDTPNGEVRIDTYKSANSTADVAYMVNVTELPSDLNFSDADGMLENSVILHANNMKGKIITSNLSTHTGYPAIAYII